MQGKKNKISERTKKRQKENKVPREKKTEVLPKEIVLDLLTLNEDKRYRPSS